MIPEIFVEVLSEHSFLFLRNIESERTFSHKTISLGARLSSSSTSRRRCNVWVVVFSSLILSLVLVSIPFCSLFRPKANVEEENRAVGCAGARAATERASERAKERMDGWNRNMSRVWKFENIALSPPRPMLCQRLFRPLSLFFHLYFLLLLSSWPRGLRGPPAKQQKRKTISDCQTAPKEKKAGEGGGEKTTRQTRPHQFRRPLAKNSTIDE